MFACKKHTTKCILILMKTIYNTHMGHINDIKIVPPNIMQLRVMTNIFVTSLTILTTPFKLEKILLHATLHQS